MLAFTSLMLLGASAVSATPLAKLGARQQYGTSTPVAVANTPVATPWNAGAVTEYPIHPSCNATQRAYIKNGLGETTLIAKQARDHILRWGNSSQIYRKYFGSAPTGEPLGWFSKIVDGDKAGILFRCDNPDGNCAQKGWAGHWRGSNASSETVICDLSYEARRPLTGLCMFGYDVANGATNFYWASDLMHRLLHIPKVGEGAVEHYTEEPYYPSVISFAKNNATYAAKNSDTLQYFALEVYAQDITLPGIGCPGTYTAVSSPAAAAATPSTSAVSSAASATPAVASPAAASPAAASPAAASPAAASAADSSPSPSAAAQGGQACTPHGDHWHCPPGVPVPSTPPA